jgi:hypothetical protein
MVQSQAIKFTLFGMMATPTNGTLEAAEAGRQITLMVLEMELGLL